MNPVNPALIGNQQPLDNKVADSGFEPFVSAVESPLRIESRDGASSETPSEVALNRDDSASAVTSDEEQRRREEEESIALARALMAEEAMAVSYRMSVDYLLHNRDQFSEEDLAALQAAMEDNEQDEEVQGEEETSDMSYELMLRLGERLGDVKTERWSQIAREKIHALPTFTFNSTCLQHMDVNDCAVKCLVCQFSYEDKECLRRLPCGHCFHKECVDQWLASKDFCPYCRKSIIEAN